jgi:carbamoyltransferase
VRERKRARESPLFLTEAKSVATCSHHLAHAYSAFALSPFEEGAVMIVDGVGSYRADVLEEVPPADETHPLAREAESYYSFRDGEPATLKKVWLEPHKGVLSDEFYAMAGLGALYSRVSSYIFGDWNKCGEVMGLAPYGRPDLAPLLTLKEGALDVPEWGTRFRDPFVGRSDRVWERSVHRRAWEDLAWRVQEDLERALVERARRLHETTGALNLCIAGGVGLNCVANAKILEETPFEQVFVQPASGDDGVALGCALYGHLALKGGERASEMTSAYLGRSYDRFDVAEAFRPLAVRAGTLRREAPGEEAPL